MGCEGKGCEGKGCDGVRCEGKGGEVMKSEGKGRRSGCFPSRSVYRGGLVVGERGRIWSCALPGLAGRVRGEGEMSSSSVGKSEEQVGDVLRRTGKIGKEEAAAAATECWLYGFGDRSSIRVDNRWTDRQAGFAGYGR